MGMQQNNDEEHVLGGAGHRHDPGARRAKVHIGADPAAAPQPLPTRRERLQQLLQELPRASPRAEITPPAPGECYVAVAAEAVKCGLSHRILPDQHGRPVGGEVQVGYGIGNQSLTNRPGRAGSPAPSRGAESADMRPPSAPHQQQPAAAAAGDGPDLPQRHQAASPARSPTRKQRSRWPAWQGGILPTERPSAIHQRPSCRRKLSPSPPRRGESNEVGVGRRAAVQPIWPSSWTIGDADPPEAKPVGGPIGTNQSPSRQRRAASPAEVTSWAVALTQIRDVVSAAGLPSPAAPAAVEGEYFNSDRVAPILQASDSSGGDGGGGGSGGGSDAQRRHHHWSGKEEDANAGRRAYQNGRPLSSPSHLDQLSSSMSEHSLAHHTASAEISDTWQAPSWSVSAITAGATISIPASEAAVVERCGMNAAAAVVPSAQPPPGPDAAAPAVAAADLLLARWTVELNRAKRLLAERQELLMPPPPTPPPPSESQSFRHEGPTEQRSPPRLLSGGNDSSRSRSSSRWREPVAATRRTKCW